MASTGTQSSKNQETQQQPAGTAQTSTSGTSTQLQQGQSQSAQASQQVSGAQQGAGAQQGSRGLSRTSGQGQGLAGEGEFGRMYFPSTAEFFSNPFGVMRRMHEEMDRAFAEALGGGGAVSGGRGTAWAPAIDVSERQGNLVVHAELPGVKPEDVQIEVENDTLVLSGRREQSEEHNEQGVHRRERRFGSFYRAIPLPEGTDTEKARAQFNQGVLEITIPMPQRQSQTRRIPINEGGK